MRRSPIRTGASLQSVHEVKYIVRWQGKLPGVPAFIIGNGCSVLHHDFSLLSDYFTIGINRAFKLIDPTILLWQDISFWKDEHEAVEKLDCLKLCRDIADRKRMFYNFHLKAGAYKFTTQTRVLFGSGSSGPLACQLAYAMGCTSLVLLGMDCKLGPQGQSDFYGDNPHWSSGTLNYCKQGLEFLKSKSPIPIFSCSDNDLWPSMSLPDAISAVDPNNNYRWGRQKYVDRILN